MEKLSQQPTPPRDKDCITQGKMGKISPWRNGLCEPLGTLSPINIRLENHRGEKVWLEETGNERGYVDSQFMKSD